MRRERRYSEGVRGERRYSEGVRGGGGTVREGGKREMFPTALPSIIYLSITSRDIEDR